MEGSFLTNSMFHLLHLVALGKLAAPHSVQIFKRGSLQFTHSIDVIKLYVPQALQRVPIFALQCSQTKELFSTNFLHLGHNI